MLTVMYTKLGRSRYLPHLDTLRHIQRILRRAEIEVEYSKGFNPHMLINMSAPLPLGFMSECELFTVRTGLEPTEFIERFNACSVDGLKIVSAVKQAKDPIVASIVHSATYEVVSPALADYAEEIKCALKDPSYKYTYTSKGKLVEKEIGEGVCSLEINRGVLRVTALCGAKTLRIDRVLQHIFAQKQVELCMDITKKVVYTNANAFSGENVEVFSYLKTLGGEL